VSTEQFNIKPPDLGLFKADSVHGANAEAEGSVYHREADLKTLLYPEERVTSARPTWSVILAAGS
jgi:hypothetical protein